VEKLKRYKFLFIHKWWLEIDKFLFFLILSLIILGIFFAFTSTSSIVADKIYKNDFVFVLKFLSFSLLSLTILFFVSTLSLNNLKTLSIVFFLLSIILLFLVLYIGVEVKGSKRWINLFVLRFQPIELYKPFLIIVIAMILTFPKIGSLDVRILLSLIILGISIFLLLSQPDVGQSFLISISWISIVFFSGIAFFKLFFIGFLILSVLTLSLFFFKEKFFYIFKRINVFFDPTKGDNLQAERALEAIKQGGFLGRGIGEGIIKDKGALEAIKQGGFLGRGIGEGIIKDKVPEAHTDFVLAVIGEEFGIITILIIFIISSLILVRLYAKSFYENNNFIKLSVLGLATLYYTQCVINIGVTLRLLPNKGMTYPFISYGGSSMIGSAILFGLVLSITSKNRQ